ncbi:MAG: hypothetical protein BWY74_03820 [Firmicutes bacterium ADurb.Bin419]|nr:MAG: hypothetical protein BWY74_03820 [Firmicutes bacterium ADurb.Bin419]
MSKEIRLPCNNERRMPTWIFISYLVCLIGGTLYSITNSPVFGYIGTMVAMYVVSKANRTQIFIFLLGTQFFRAVIRVDLIFMT